MKKIIVLVFSLFCLPVFAFNGTQFGVGVSGTSGFNILAGYYNKSSQNYLLRHFGVRFDYANMGPLKSAVDSAIDHIMKDGIDVGDGVKIDRGELDSWHSALLLDYYPFAGWWRITGGYVWGSADLSAEIFGKIATAPDARFYFYLAGDHYFYNGNEFGGRAFIDWNFYGPYLGTGFDIGLFCGFSLFFDAGVVFTNRSARLSLDIPHEQLYVYNKDTATWSPVTIPALDKDVIRATQEGNDKLSNYKFFPMLKLGFVYNF